MEDSGAHEIVNWATGISAGAPYEASQTLTFVVETNNPALFSASPTIDVTGTLRFTTAPNANGIAAATAILYDDGGMAYGGINASTPYNFIISATPVNDAPSFTKGGNLNVLEDSGEYVQANWATSISAGPPDEAGQTLTFAVSTNNASLFSSPPTIDSLGKLRFTPAANASGVALATATLHDNGGTAYGGVDTSAPQTFTITVTDVNDQPSFVGGPNIGVLEDSPAQEFIAWATGISPGPILESTQALYFLVENNNPALFSATPAINATGTLTFTPAPNQNGIAYVTATLYDDGGTANGGINASTPFNFIISVTAVNDAPLFYKGPNQVVIEDASAQTIIGWATGISAGPPNEASQTLTFLTWSTNDALFSATPIVNASGTLYYLPAPDQNGLATVTIQLLDSGGTAYGGVNVSATQQFTITVLSVNDAPILSIGPDQAILEDAGAQTVIGFATGEAGPPDEAWQSLIYDITNTNLALFAEFPAINSFGTLTYTPADDANGSATVTVKLKDNGGTAYGGVDSSTPSNFIISVTPVNDAPSFIPGATIALVNTAGLPQEFIQWATGISAGPPNEASQTLTFLVTPNHPELFAASPTIDATGTLHFTPALGAHGVVNATVVLIDNGGWAYGGQPISDVTEYNTILFETYLWGDMNDNAIVGAVDASLILRYDNGSLYDSGWQMSYFPAFPPSQYPEYLYLYYVEYYPIPFWHDKHFNPAADVNWDQRIGTVDASHVLQYYVLLLAQFEADVNGDKWGPDYTPGGKTAQRTGRRYVSERTMSARIETDRDGKGWTVSFAVDDPADLCGIRLGLRFDPKQVQVEEQSARWLVRDVNGLIAGNGKTDGIYIVSGALSAELDGSNNMTHPTEIIVLRFSWVGEETPDAPVIVSIDETLTRLNDGLIPLQESSVTGIDLLNETTVSSWMVY